MLLGDQWDAQNAADFAYVYARVMVVLLMYNPLRNETANLEISVFMMWKEASTTSYQYA